VSPSATQGGACILRHISVKSADELKERILKGIAEFYTTPVVFRWNGFNLGVD
jgi:hypothetical protein